MQMRMQRNVKNRPLNRAREANWGGTRERGKKLTNRRDSFSTEGTQEMQKAISGDARLRLLPEFGSDGFVCLDGRGNKVHARGKIFIQAGTSAIEGPEERELGQ
jgi:hypothetical protein